MGSYPSPGVSAALGPDGRATDEVRRATGEAGQTRGSGRRFFIFCRRVGPRGFVRELDERTAEGAPTVDVLDVDLDRADQGCHLGPVVAARTRTAREMCS